MKSNSLLNESGLQSYKSDRKSPAAVLAILEKAPTASNWRANFDARIEEGGPCLLFCRACAIGVSPNNISNSTNAHMKACKGGSTNDAGCVVELDLDSPSKNTHQQKGQHLDSPSKNTRQQKVRQPGLKLGVAASGLITKFTLPVRGAS